MNALYFPIWSVFARGWARALALAALMTPAALLLAAAINGAAAPLLNVPVVPPGRAACNAGWQSGPRVAAVGAGADSAAGYLIESGFDAAQAHGRLLRRPLGVGKGEGGADALSVGSPLWDAGALLDAGQPPAGARRIFTLSGAGLTVPFEWAHLDAAQQAALDPAGDGLGEARLAFLRGDRVREGDPFRRRAGVLGDIVRSTPVLVGAPAADGAAASEPGYADFYQRHRQRQRLVYAGANDGMLHAFDWNDGAERFAYVPALLLPALHQLSAGVGTYTARAWVDGTPGQGAAVIGGQWRSVLASGLGMGARGLFALDITDPAADPVVLWEFGESDDPAIGFIHAAPAIVKLRGASSAYRYFALVDGGFNRADGGADSVLFLLALDKPAAAPWRLGDNYFRLHAPARDPQAVNALAPPVVTLAVDGSAHSAYAGDLQGTMWRFDFDGLTGIGGGSARTTASALFRARAADGAVQPIVEAARVVFAPGGGYLVLFGTGRAIEAADLDPAGFVQQSFYAVRDTDAQPMATVSGRGALAERRLTAAGGGAADGFLIAGERFDYNGAGRGVKHGWYFDYPRSLQDGERVAAAPVMAGSALVIASTAPGADRCAPTVRSYIVDSVSGLAHDSRGAARDGAASGLATGRGAPSRDGSLPFVLTRYTGAGTPTPTGAMRALRTVAVFQLPAGGAGALLDRVAVGMPAGRLSWREIANWRELHAAAVAQPPPASPLR